MSVSDIVKSPQKSISIEAMLLCSLYFWIFLLIPMCVNLPKPSTADCEWLRGQHWDNDTRLSTLLLIFCQIYHHHYLYNFFLYFWHYVCSSLLFLFVSHLLFSLWHFCRMKLDNHHTVSDLSRFAFWNSCIMVALTI